MSSRQRKRLLKGDDDLAHLRALESPSEDDAPVLPKKHNKKKNKDFRNFMADFATMDGEEKDNSVSNDSEQDKEPVVEKPPPAASPQKSKKKKKKKKKGNQAIAQNEEDVDAILKSMEAELKILEEQNKSPDDTTKSEDATFEELFKVITKNLNSQTELHRIFGKGIGSSGEQSNPRLRALYPRSNFVQPKAMEWAPIRNLGVGMTLDERDAGETKKKVFKYTHSKLYHKFEKNFRLAIELHQDQEFMAILQEKPYHANTLLTMADVYRSQGDFTSERDMIDKCLYGLESATDSRFSLASSDTRLDYRRPENRPLFLCLYQHAVLLSKRACNRTALECLKLLVSLDPIADPLGIFLLVDHFAILSGQYAWLEKVSNLEKRNFKKLPNFVYSLALAKYRQSEAGDVDESEAKDLLVSAVIAFPGLVVFLADKLNISINTEDKAKLISLDDAGKPLITLYKLYVERSSVCWQGDSILPFLASSTQRALGILTEATCDAEDFKIEVDAASTNRQRFVALPENILRHLILSGYQEPIAYVHLCSPGKKVLAYDPFPPKDEIVTYEALSANWREEVPGARLRGNTLGNFLETMIRPGVSIREMLERVRDEEGTGAETTATQRISDELRDIFNRFRENLAAGELGEEFEGDHVDILDTSNTAENDEEMARRLQEEEWD